MSKEEMEMYLTHALHYIAEQEGQIIDFLDNYDLYEEFFENEYSEYFGFDEKGEEK